MGTKPTANLLIGLALTSAAVAVLRERRTAERLHEAHQLATHDPLTGLLNRAGLTHAWRHHHTTVTAVAVIDLDGFKPVNDAHGHQAGDHLLTVIARRLATAPGVVARLGGDEFAVLFTTRSPVDATRVLAAGISVPVTLPDGPTVTVTGSVGVTHAAGLDLSTALADADAAMYRAKTSSSGIGVYTPGIDDHPNPTGRPAVRVRDLSDHLTTIAA